MVPAYGGLVRFSLLKVYSEGVASDGDFSLAHETIKNNNKINNLLINIFNNYSSDLR